MLLAVSILCENASTPRTGFPDDLPAEPAADILQLGILQPLIVQSADDDGQPCAHFGAERLRAAIRAGLPAVAVVLREDRKFKHSLARGGPPPHGR